MQIEFGALNTRLTALLTILFLTLAGAGFAQAAEKTCGEGDAFGAQGPSGWSKIEEPSRDGMTYTFIPPGETMEGSSIAMAVRMPNPQKTSSGPPDLDRLLEKRLGMLAMLGDPISISELEIENVDRPVAAAALKLRTGMLHYAVIDARSGHGHTFVASLAKQDRDLDSKELQQFEKLIASLQMDPRSCEAMSGPSVSPFPAAISSDASMTRIPDTDTKVAMRRAYMGCRWLDQMNVPVECKVTMASRRPALLASFSDGRDSAEAYLDRYHNRIAASYCWGRERHDLPRLVFQAGADGRYREFNCSSMN